MTSLEQLCIDLGIAEHIPALSEWRDDLIREKATELQGVRLAAEVAIDEARQALAVANAEVARLSSLCHSDPPV